MKPFKYIIRLTFLLFMLSSCEKMLDTGEPKTMLQTEMVFSNQEAAMSAVAGFYQRLILNSGAITNGGVTLYAGLSADELVNLYPDEELDRFVKNELLENDDFGISVNLWESAFKNIYHANSILEGVEKSTLLNSTVKDQVRGEMLLGRALQYFYLVGFFGPVPLVLSTAYETNQSLPRSAEHVVFDQVVADTKEAGSLLQEGYPSSGRVRPNRFAALGLLARMHLYQERWQEAYDAASEIISQNSVYKLAPVNETFNANSMEAIWQIQPIEGGYTNTGEGYMFNPFDEWSTPLYYITDSLLGAFALTDTRRNWLGFNEASGIPLYYPRKYKVGVGTDITEHYSILRLAEIYLIRAEASLKLGNIEAALADLNMIRARANLPPVESENPETVMEAIMAERRLELFCEWGHRWFDLKRTQKANEVLGTYKHPTWQPSDALYPVPLNQRRLNPFLNQNAGY